MDHKSGDYEVVQNTLVACQGTFIGEKLRTNLKLIAPLLDPIVDNPVYEFAVSFPSFATEDVEAVIKMHNFSLNLGYVNRSVKVSLFNTPYLVELPLRLPILDHELFHGAIW